MAHTCPGHNQKRFQTNVVMHAREKAPSAAQARGGSSVFAVAMTSL